MVHYLTVSTEQRCVIKSNHLACLHQAIRTQSIFLLSELYIILISYTPPKEYQHVLFFISKGILDQISIVLCLIILAPEFERAFGKANCRSLSERLLLVKHSQSGSN